MIHVSCCKQDEADAVPAIDKFFKNTWNAQRPSAPKPAQQGQQQQPAANWPGGSKQMHGYTSPILTIPPEQYAQYLQQYQHQRMLHHLHQQQQQYQQQIQHATRHPQHAKRADSAQVTFAAAPSIHPSAHPSVNLSQYHAQQQQQRWQGAMPSATSSMDSSGKPAAPFVAHVRTGSSDSIAQPSTEGSAVDTQPPTPMAPDTAAAARDNSADNETDIGSFDNGEKALDNKLPPPPPKSAFSGPQSEPPAIAGPPSGQLPGASDLLSTCTSAPHTAVHPPHTAAVHESPLPASCMPPNVAMPAADAITAAQGGRVHASSSAGGWLDGSPPRHGGTVMGQPVPPPMMMASVGYPPGHQVYGMPLALPPGNGREMYPYGGMMVPMMPGMMLPPPPQLQTRAGRGGRANAASANPAGLAALAANLCTISLLLLLLLLLNDEPVPLDALSSVECTSEHTNLLYVQLSRGVPIA